LDEWLYAFKNEEVLPSFKSHNIDQLDKKLNVLKMTEAERRRYDNYLLQRASDEGVIESAEQKGEKRGIEKGRKAGLKAGLKEGRKAGREEGLEEGQQRKAVEIAKNLLDVLDDATIAAKTGLSAAQVAALRPRNKGSAKGGGT
jgi:flagellar biosynthesis/type III secretory pathway protein FliH